MSWSDSGPPTAVTSGAAGSRPSGDAPVLPAGTIVGRYTVRSVLGLGGMGVVYEARDPQLGRAVALKLLRRDVSPEGHADLRREAQALARLDHPNVVTIHDVGTHDGGLWVAMELVDGITGTEWIARERPLHETLEVLRQAADGLAAVHDAGLVHRDFKPGNIMITADGRVRVMDFGLAHLVRVTTDGTPTEGAGDSLDSQWDDSGTPFGTAAYMAPEQHRAEVPLPLGDQFSFCATAYEALYGVRAFAAESMAGLSLAIVRGELQTPPAGARVPAWLHRVVRRGLSVRPEDRFPSMHALRDALQPPRRRWPWLLAGVGAASLLAAAFIRDRGPDCTQAGRRIDEMWNDDARTEIAQAFASTELPFRDQSLGSTIAALDDRAQRWREAAVAACEAAAEGDDAQPTLDLRMRCLGQRLEATRGLIEAVRAADPSVVQQSTGAVAKLPAIADCEDAEALAAAELRPADAELAAVVDELEARNAHVKGLLDAGKTKAALKAAEALVEDARAAGYAPTIAHALDRLAGAHGLLGDVAEARRLLEEAHLVVTRERLDREAADLASMLVYWTALGADLDDAERWKREAEAALARAGDPPQSRASFLRNVIALDQARGDFPSGIAHATEALELYTDLFGEDHPNTMIALQNLGTMLLVDRQLEAAAGPLHRAHAASVRLHGELHPDTGKIASNLAALEIYRGRKDEALRWLEAADVALTTVPGARASILNNRSQLLDARGEREEAVAVLREAVAALVLAHGDDHPSTWTGRSDLANALERAGHPREALDLQLQVRDARRRLLGPDHLDTVFTELRIASSLRALDRDGEALETARTAAQTAERALGPEHPTTAMALTSVGLTLVRLHRAEDAIAPLERALSIREQALGPDHLEPAETAGILARARFDIGDAGTARRLAERAWPLLSKLSEHDERRLDAKRVLEAVAASENGPASTR